MRRLVVAITMALAVSAAGAASGFAASGLSGPSATGPSGPSGCHVDTPRGAIALPAQACRHVPTLWRGRCVLVTGAGQVIYLPRQACNYGPRPGSNGPQQG